MQSYKEKYGQWALVLGATEGIGRAGAIELAHRGMDIILVGRREDKLHELAEFIKSDSGHGAMVMEYDLALPDTAAACCSTPQTWRSAWCAMWPANAARGPLFRPPTRTLRTCYRSMSALSPACCTTSPASSASVAGAPS